MKGAGTGRVAWKHWFGNSDVLLSPADVQALNRRLISCPDWLARAASPAALPLAFAPLRTHLALAALTPGATPINNRTNLEQPHLC